MHTTRNHFAGCFSEMEIKARYRDLCRAHHPDLHPHDPDATARMQDVNGEYRDALRGEYRKTKNDDDAENACDADAHAAETLAGIIMLPGILIEIVGRWIWVTGETYPVRAELKAAGFRFASRKVAWYWHAPEDKCRGGKKTLEEIKTRYGARTVATRSLARLG